MSYKIEVMSIPTFWNFSDPNDTMRVLFICKANIGRSQMALAFFSRLAPSHNGLSAGIDVPIEQENQPISTRTTKTVKCMAAIGIDIANSPIHRVTLSMITGSDLIISLVPKDDLPELVVQKSKKLKIWNVPDAGGTSYSNHVKVRDMIQDRVKRLALQLEANLAEGV